MLSGKEAWPLIEGGKGIAVTNGESSGAWAATGGVGTFSGVNADTYDGNGQPLPIIYEGRTRRERHEELLAYAIRGGIAQARIAHEVSGGAGRIHMNVLWEMGGAERVLHGILSGARGLIHGVTCGAGMPYRMGQIAANYGVYYYPIVSSARAFRALWRRTYHRFSEWLGGVVYEDPWRAGGHNGLSNSEDPEKPEDPKPRVTQLRRIMNEMGLGSVPVIMAGGVWYLREWEDWIDDPDIAPVAFQFGTRPLLTQESPIPDEWKKGLLGLKPGDVTLNRYSPTGFYSSAIRNTFLRELETRSLHQIPYADEPVGKFDQEFRIGPRGRSVFVTAADRDKAERWMKQGLVEGMRTPDSTVIFVSPEKSREIRTDQVNCMGCLSQCQFSSWAQNEAGSTGRRPDPRSYCIQKTLQDIVHQGNIERQLMFSGHNGYKFQSDPFYANGFIPTVKQLVAQLHTGD